MPKYGRVAAFAALSLSLPLAGVARAADAAGPKPSAPVGAHADISDAQGKKVGEARFTQQGDDLVVSLSVSGVASGQHGAHIHMTGLCDAPDFKSAGGHWNPASLHHGLQNPQGHHMGDMPNLDVGADGRGALTFTIKNAAISGGTAPLLDADGASIVIHAGPDDMMTDPAGNSGARLACGVIVAG